MTADTAIYPATVLPTGPDDDRTNAGTFATCALSGDVLAAGVARHFTRSTLCGWEMDALVDNVEVIVSEMLSNAIRHGLTGSRDLAVAGTPNLVGLGLLRRGRTVVCAVSDPSTDVPVVREPDYFSECGRGLHLIDSLSESWGWTPPNHAGKAVWATVSASDCG
ncbi:ATP-binding protein [Peterkaempfera bronchialis]|uniref:ATP-binding protein n=1 Tax=Peterkaempfera bronchialis TaxID=2126346 RepID=A0A345T087_9ACTN|nr:ATP-binding protein [Peterkaempfera bronchialis]AXI79392.1 ATP-binding protein [Peterkaempfera bronchialis]